jgi:pyridoxamine 5'-phosphate oxidase family protein
MDPNVIDRWPGRPVNGQCRALSHGRAAGPLHALSGSHHITVTALVVKRKLAGKPTADAACRRNALAATLVSPGMSVFTDKELEYLAGQRLGRIATVGPDGQPHVVPTSFRYNAEHDAIDLGGLRMSQTKKLRDVQRTGRASIVIDDVLPPWQPRMIEVRGTAAVIPSGGKALNERFEDTIVRIQPTRIISFGIDPGETASARSVSPA